MFSIDFFGSMLDERLHASGRHSTRVELRRKENLYVCGDSDESVYLITSGHIKAVTVTPGGKGCLLAFYSRYDLLGESCLLSPVRQETATAMTPVVARKIPRSWFLEALSTHGLFEEYLQYLTTRLFEQQEHITHLVTCDSEQRLAATLLRMARRQVATESDWVMFDQKITHEELAAMVGTTRSRIGFFLKRFRELSAVETTPKNRLMVHPERLEHYMDECSLA
ncbi:MULTISPECIES: Crp/Fnr family transcriptional regulator [Streptomyces]|uniref:Crp/Fnr family transcriptional regulator n=1 Tax=Streptomyces TaxID=1883 RepID=UPI0006895C2B|nr:MULTISPECIES: Crp/Fnr family transcriptional regulator [Streptomyces]